MAQAAATSVNMGFIRRPFRTYLYAAAIVVEALMCAVTFIWLLVAVDGLRDKNLSDVANGIRELNGFALSSAILFFYAAPSVVLMVLWFDGMNANLSSAGAQPLPRLRMALGFFIPVYCWLHRYRVSLRIWLASTEDRAPLRLLMAPLATAASTVCRLSVFTIHGNDLEGARLVALVSTAHALCWFVGCICELLVIRDLGRALESRARARSYRKPLGSLLSHVPTPGR